MGALITFDVLSIASMAKEARNAQLAAGLEQKAGQEENQISGLMTIVAGLTITEKKRRIGYEYP